MMVEWIATGKENSGYWVRYIYAQIPLLVPNPQLYANSMANWSLLPCLSTSLGGGNLWIQPLMARVGLRRAILPKTHHCCCNGCSKCGAPTTFRGYRTRVRDIWISLKRKLQSKEKKINGRIGSNCWPFALMHL